MASSNSITFDLSGLTKDFAGVKERVQVALMMLASTEAQKLEAYMKSNRPWTDRTGEAKRRLSAIASRPSEHEVRITLAHGVNYGIWLELAHERKYAIIQPTINEKSNEFFEDAVSLMKKVLP